MGPSVALQHITQLNEAPVSHHWLAPQLTSYHHYQPQATCFIFKHATLRYLFPTPRHNHISSPSWLIVLTRSRNWCNLTHWSCRQSKWMSHPDPLHQPFFYFLRHYSFVHPFVFLFYRPKFLDLFFIHLHHYCLHWVIFSCTYPVWGSEFCSFVKCSHKNTN